MAGIYKITNQLNGKIYIGQSVRPNQRWLQHQSEVKMGRSNTLLYNSMRKYGIENFTFEVIEECQNEELNEREIYWISYYDSFQNGYNMTPGGSESIKINPQEIYDLWDSGYTVGQIEKKLANKISGCTVKNYLHEYEKWSVTESRKRSSLLTKGNNDINNVIKQYDLFGHFIKNWRSIREASEELNIPHNSIGEVLKNKFKQAGGFQWKIGDINDTLNIEDITDKVPLHFEIIQKDLYGNFIKRYKTLKEASAAVHTNPANIARVCKHQNNRRTAKGFIWEYDYNSWYDPD